MWLIWNLRRARKRNALKAGTDVGVVTALCVTAPGFVGFSIVSNFFSTTICAFCNPTPVYFCTTRWLRIRNRNSSRIDLYGRLAISSFGTRRPRSSRGVRPMGARMEPTTMITRVFDLPAVRRCPSGLPLDGPVQFHRWPLNCCWHSCLAMRIPWPTAAIASGAAAQILRWPAVSPTIRLQMTCAPNALAGDLFA